MDDGAMERAQERVEQRADEAALDALLVRAREQVEALSALGDALPERVEAAVHDQAQPMARNLAEIRGLANQLIRRLSALEGDLLTERNARVDDLALLVDLVSSGWKGVDARLGRIEAVVNRLEQQTHETRGAIVYRMEDRRPDAATS
jgi:inorganic triphosphatase YgiF